MTKIVRNEREIARLYEALGYGMLNFGFAIQADYQQSFQQGSGPLPRPRSRPGEPPAAQTGNLRRSAHAVAYVNGRVLEHTPGVDIPDYGGEIGPTETGVIVGTNAGYGLFLEVGTARMAARPALVPAAVRQQRSALALVTAGAQRHYGRPRP